MDFGVSTQLTREEFEKNYKIRPPFSAALQSILQKKGVQLKSLSAYGLSRATISRLRHGKLKGKDYVPDIKTIAWVAIGLKLTLDEYYELLYAAYPELEVYPQMINLGYAIYDADKFLYDYGLCTFSSPYD